MNSMMGLRTYGLASILLVFFCQVCAEAGTIIQTQGFVGSPQIHRSVEFNQFNGSPGDLTSITIAFELGITGGSLTVDNDGQLPTQVEVELGAAGQLASLDVPLVDTASNSIFSGATALAVSTGAILDLAGDNGDGTAFDSTLPDAKIHLGEDASVNNLVHVAPTLFPQYVGAGTFDIVATIESLVDFGGIETVAGEFTPVTTSSKITLVYEYVPEPSGLIMMAIGLMLFNVSASRRRLCR